MREHTVVYVIAVFARRYCVLWVCSAFYIGLFAFGERMLYVFRIISLWKRYLPFHNGCFKEGKSHQLTWRFTLKCEIWPGGENQMFYSTDNRDGSYYILNLSLSMSLNFFIMNAVFTKLIKVHCITAIFQRFNW